ncbi:MAG: hypothetical protein GF355_07455 [Candidatus Eisenbacteria bacterium]|nr:hypothetical protein [Candidatus Eisenbacteria bacterium]
MTNLTPLFFNPQKKLKNADEALANGFHYDALKIYRSVLKRTGDDPTVAPRAEEGRRKARRGLMERQLEEARGLWDDGRYVEAIECAENAVDLADDDGDRRRAGELLERIKAAGNQALRARPDVPGGGTACAAPLVTDEAPADVGEEDLFQLYLDTLPEERAETYRSFGEVFSHAYVLTQQGRGSEALEHYDTLPDDVRRHPLVRLLEGQALGLAGRDAAALETLAMHGLPEDLEPVRLELKAAALWKLGRRDEAEAAAREMVAAAPEDVRAAHILAQFQAAAGKAEEALATLAPWIHPTEVIPEIDRLAIWLQLQTGRQDDAVAILERTVKRYFHHSLSRSCGRQVNPSFGLQADVFPAPGSEDAAADLPRWAARTLLDLYLSRDEPDEDKVRELVESLIMYDPAGEIEYRDKLERYLTHPGPS